MDTKKIRRINNLHKWVILIGLAFFIFFISFLSLADLAIIRDKAIIKDWHLRLVMLLLAFFSIFRIINEVIKYFAERLNYQYLERFHFLTDTQSYLEAAEKSFFPKKKYEHVVLLLHGFAASPQEFQFLTEHLKRAGICYYAPNIIGFGSNNTQLLNKTTRYDWYRSSLNHFDLLAGMADKVSIIGHSMGGILATYIAARRNVEHLILSAPGLFCFPADLKYKKILVTPILSSLYIKLVPYLPKPLNPNQTTVCDMLDEEQAQQIFQYMAIPMHSLRELAHAQDEFSPSDLKFTKLSILYGEQERTIDISQLFSILEKYEIKHQNYSFANSGHNILEDFDHEECSALITQILQEKSNF